MMKQEIGPKPKMKATAGVTMILHLSLALCVAFVALVGLIVVYAFIYFSIYFLFRPNHGKLMNAPPPPVVNPRPTQ